MATFDNANIQMTPYEVRLWTADFTDDLPSAVTVTTGAATHVPPYGAAATPTVTASSPYVSAQLGTGLILGNHALDILATFSNGEKSAVRIAFTVVYASATVREGMTPIIDDLRAATDTSPGDYAVANVPYWTDKQLQDVLDRFRKDRKYMPTEPNAEYANSVYTYNEYHIPAQCVEGGTALTMQDGVGNAYGTALYTFDYQRSMVTFAANMIGSVVNASWHEYDLNRAAAHVWRRKASHYSSAYDLSTDNHNLRRSQLIRHCLDMAQIYETYGGPNSIYLARTDTNASY